MTAQDVAALKERILNGYLVTSEEALELLKVEDKEQLYQMADDIRRHFLKNDFEMCSIINARSGRCRGLQVVLSVGTARHQRGGLPANCLARGGGTGAR